MGTALKTGYACPRLFYSPTNTSLRKRANSVKCLQLVMGPVRTVVGGLVAVGADVVGAIVGMSVVGAPDGRFVGAAVGLLGAREGANVGGGVGEAVGEKDTR